MICTGARPAVGQLRWVAALLVLAVAGCDAASTDSSQPSGPPSASGTPASTAPPPPSTAPTSSATPTTAPPTSTAAPTRGTISGSITLVKSGGLAGLAETITVQPDGKWKQGDARNTNRTGRLSAAQLSRLQALVADPRLDAEAKQSTPGANKCNDAFTYLLMVDYQMIKYEQCGQGKPPEVTMKIISLLQEATAG